MLEETHMEDYIKDADIILTGEGRLDAQTVMAKPPKVWHKWQKNTKNLFWLFQDA